MWIKDRIIHISLDDLKDKVREEIKTRKDDLVIMFED